MDYRALLNQPWMGKTLDERFVNVLEWQGRNVETARLLAEKKAIQEQEKAEREIAKSIAREKALSKLDPKWQTMHNAPRDGTEIIGLDWNGGWEILNILWQDGNWVVGWCPGYDMEGNELQPIRWMPI